MIKVKQATSEDAAPMERSSELKWGVFAAILLALVAINVAHVWPLITRYGIHGVADFFSFYSGCQVLRQGLAGHMFDVSGPYQKQFMAYNHPAYELLVFLPVSWLPPVSAFWTWNGVNLLMLAGIAWLLPKQRKGFPGSGVAWIVLGAMAFFPVVLTFMQGQDSIFLLLIFTFVYRCLTGNRQVLAGAVLACGLFKFMLIVPFFLPWVLRGRWKFISGFAVGSVLVATLCVAMVGWQGNRQYVELLLHQGNNSVSNYFDPRWMPTWYGLVSILWASAAPRAIVLVSGSLSLIFVALATWRLVEGTEGNRFDLWFAMNILSATLASAYLYGHNLAPVFLALLLMNHAAAMGGARSIWMACGILSCVLFCTPLYLQLQTRELLALLSVPLLLLFLLFAFAPTSVEWGRKSSKVSES